MFVLKSSMLMMRRHEKDFMLREEDKSIEDLKKESANFAKVLEASLISHVFQRGFDSLLFQVLFFP